jgi:CheY-like chemotaxis protein
MGGELAFTSQPGRGSRFWFEIPCVACERPPAASRADRYLPLSGTVLLVEDSPVNLEVATLMLQGFGLAVHAAVDGEEALTRLAQTRFDLVLMDCHLPGMDGFEATRRFRALEAQRRRRRTAVVALTANAVQGDRQQCLAAGMDDYLAKPFRQEDLYGAVQRNLAGAAAARPFIAAPLAGTPSP